MNTIKQKQSISILIPFSLALFFVSVAFQPTPSFAQLSAEELMDAMDEDENKKKTQTKENSGASNNAPQQRIALKGPKRTLSVGKFTSTGAYTAKYGNWDIGGGLGAMLTTALVNSGQFIVLERAQLTNVLREQEMKVSGLTKSETGPKLKQLAGAQILIQGAVTEFSTGDSGGGLNLGITKNLGNLPFNLGGATESSSGKVAMDIRVIDNSTGQVLESHNVSHEIEDSAFDISGGYSGISLGGNKFDKTPLGEATRGAIQKAVAAIAASAARVPWTGLVVAMKGKSVVINAGRNSGVKKGDMFMIERVGDVFTDPSTGEVLGSTNSEIGVLRLVNIHDKFSFGSFQPLSTSLPKRGDRIKVMRR